jgi:hypothetical protein
MTWHTKATINLAAGDIRSLIQRIRSRAGVLESAQTDVLTLCISNGDARCIGSCRNTFMKNLGTFLCKWTGTSQKCCFRSINTPS